MKQYLLVCDETAMSKLDIFLGLQFIEVQGMNVPNQNVNVLVTPIIPPVSPLVTENPTPQSQDDCCSK